MFMETKKRIHLKITHKAYMVLADYKAKHLLRSFSDVINHMGDNIGNSKK